jgi:uncharacterized Fe-S radical SAM superfamily protein PflX
VETLRGLEGKVDVWLPDLKYSDPKLARLLSAAPDYVEVAKAAILEMYRQTGPCVVEDGLLKRGVLIRHLVLPACVFDTRDVLSAISDARPESGFGAMDMLHELTKVPVPAPLAALRDRKPRFSDCVDRNDMLEYVKKAIK